MPPRSSWSSSPSFVRGSGDERSQRSSSGVSSATRCRRAPSGFGPSSTRLSSSNSQPSLLRCSPSRSLCGRRSTQASRASPSSSTRARACRRAWIRGSRAMRPPSGGLTRFSPRTRRLRLRSFSSRGTHGRSSPTRRTEPLSAELLPPRPPDGKGMADPPTSRAGSRLWGGHRPTSRSSFSAIMPRTPCFSRCASRRSRRAATSVSPRSRFARTPTAPGSPPSPSSPTGRTNRSPCGLRSPTTGAVQPSRPPSSLARRPRTSSPFPRRAARAS